jgi:monofunctional biosynthetic peptidoglycan transglycosylase
VAAAAALALLAAAAVWDATQVPLGRLDRRAPFPTALMRARATEAKGRGDAPRIEFRFVPYDRISPLLRRAVLVAEDDAFFHHGGLDWNEIGASARRNLEEHRIVRGGSTITQQLARNLYLGEQRTVTRKLEEIVLALRIERAVSKRRILELYLNLIEWGDGIYGVEAAAERYFGTTADALDARQALLLASVIINPRRFSPLAPPPRIERRVRTIAGRMLRRGQLSEAEYRLAVGEAPPAPAPGEDGGSGQEPAGLEEAHGAADTAAAASADSTEPAPDLPR